MLRTDYEFQPIDERHLGSVRAAQESRQAARRTAMAVVAANLVAIVALIMLST